MSFKIVIDGKVVHEIEDNRVTKVRVLTTAGEAATVGIDPDQTELVLAFDVARRDEINLVDLDKFKLGYGANLTGEDVEARREQIESVRGKTNEGQSVFTDEAREAREKADKEAREAAEKAVDEGVAPVNPLEAEHPGGPVEATAPDTDPGEQRDDSGADDKVPAFALAPDSMGPVDKDLATPGTETT